MSGTDFGAKIGNLGGKDWLKAAAGGIGISILTAAVMVTALKSGMSPLGFSAWPSVRC